MRNFLQKIDPFWLVLLMAATMTLPWIGTGEFYTKGEPREAAEVFSMLNDGRWVLPREYADETAYKPPLMHWMIAGFSLLTGSVSEATSRLPSALGLIGLTLITFQFLRRRTSVTLAALAALILASCFELHRNSLECRVDMTLTFFMSAALFGLYVWEEKKLKGYPVLTVAAMTCACLVKGPVGVVLPAGIAAVYYLLRGHRFVQVCMKSFLVVVPPLLVLGVWYFLAWRDDGDRFLSMAFAENIGRFLGIKNEQLGIRYVLGHQAPFWYYIPALLTGLMPWALLPLIWLFVLPYRKLRTTHLADIQDRLKNLRPFTLFSILVVCIFLVFYSIPISKRSVYIMPAYPFVAYLLALLFEHTVNRRPGLIKPLKGFVLTIVMLMLAFSAVAFFFDLHALAVPFIKDEKVLHDIGLLAGAFHRPDILTGLVWFLLLAVTIAFLRLRRSPHAKTMLFGIFALYVSLVVFLEGSVYTVWKDGNSSKPLARYLEQHYDIAHRGYVMNDLLRYPNLYGLNFYLGNRFRNFELERPADGYLLTGAKSLEKVRAAYKGLYEFKELERSDPYNEMNDEIVVCQIVEL